MACNGERSRILRSQYLKTNSTNGRLPEHFATPSITPKTFPSGRRDPSRGTHSVRDSSEIARFTRTRPERFAVSNVGKRFRELPAARTVHVTPPPRLESVLQFVEPGVGEERGRVMRSRCIFRLTLVLHINVCPGCSGNVTQTSPSPLRLVHGDILGEPDTERGKV